jgi:hypothetical protein
VSIKTSLVIRDILGVAVKNQGNRKLRYSRCAFLRIEMNLFAQFPEKPPHPYHKGYGDGQPVG